MGFLLTLETNTVVYSFGTSNTSSSGTITVTIPKYVRDGDLILVCMATAGDPTIPITGPAGYTNLFPQKNGANSFLGRFAIFQHTWRHGDTMTPAFVGSATHNSPVQGIIVRSNVDGDSLVIGNPPSNGFAGTYDDEETSAVKTWSQPQIAVDHPTDLRILFSASKTAAGGTSGVVVGPTESAVDGNPFANKWISQSAANPSTGPEISFAQMHLVSVSDAGASIWTSGTPLNDVRYTVGFAISDGGAAPFPCEDADPGVAHAAMPGIGTDRNLNVSSPGGGVQIF